MRVFLIGDGWFPDKPGGLNRYVRCLAESLPLVAVDTDVEVAVLGPASDPPASVHVPATSGAPLRRRVLGTFKAVPGDIDLLDVHFALYGLLPILARRARRRATVVHFHGPWADESVVEAESRPAVWIKRQVECAVYRRAGELVTLSTAFKRLLVERYHVSPWRVSVIPPGVDLDHYHPGNRTAARAHWAVVDSAWTAVAVRRLVPRMGIDVLLRAWARAAIAEAVLIIAGEGPEGPGLVDLARELGIGGSVRFVGRVEEAELPQLYQAADVSLVPTRSLEGFGLTVLESLATGTPVISSDAGGLPEVTSSLKPRLVVPAGNVEALSAQLTSARSGAVPSRQACRTHAESFTWRLAAERHTDLYRRAFSRPQKSKLRVVYLDHTARLSGAELALARLLPALVGDVDCHVILAEDGPLVRRLLESGISVEVLPMVERARGVRRDSISARSLPGAASYTFTLVRRLHQLRPDLVHANSLKAALYGSGAARLVRVPCIWHARDRIAPDYMPARPVQFVRLAARILPTAVVANSRATLATLPGVRRAFVVPSPIDLPPRLPRQNGGPFRVGMVGRIAPWKGQHVFIEGFARAFPDGDQQAVVIGAPLFGDDETGYLEELRRLGRRLGLGTRLVFTGFCDPVTDELSRLDVLVHASTTPEPFGQVVLEGMASGLAVVAAAIGGPLELVEDGRDGVLVEPGNAAALGEVLRRLEREPQLRARLGEEGRRKAAAFTPAAVARSITDVYEKVIAQS